MADWDSDSEQLFANLKRVISDVRDASFRRVTPTVQAAREWQTDFMEGLEAPRPEYVGRFRGEPGLIGYEVTVGGYRGVDSDKIAEELSKFEDTLQKTVDLLDRQVRPGNELNADNLAAVIDVCAWVHSEWVRIHPFANGNGRTARLWANSLAMRYGLPPFVQPRPRPGDGYGEACTEAMEGHWQPTARVFRSMYVAAVRS